MKTILNFVRTLRSQTTATCRPLHRLLLPSACSLLFGTGAFMYGSLESDIELPNFSWTPLFPLKFSSALPLAKVSAESKDMNRRMRHRRHLQQFGHELCTAVRNGDTSAVKQLLQNSGSDPDARSPYGWAPLHIAVVNGDIGMARLLLEAGANVNINDMTNPFMNGSVRREQFSAKIHSNAPTQGWTALHFAAAFLNEEMIRLLVLENGANPEAKDQRGATCFDYLDERHEEMRRVLDLIEECREAYLCTKEERERQFRLRHPIEEQLKQKIVGQLTPINNVAAAVRRKLNGWHDEDHPLVFLFLGSSGVGKTELAKTLAAILHKDNCEAFIRIDMSEFQHKHEVAKFIGAPPGYVGHEKGGQLTSKLKQFPNAVVLLDEVEKAHPDILTVMLQLFDEGRMTDGKGETVECKDAIFVMTSNLAQTEIGDYSEALRKEAKKDYHYSSVSVDDSSVIRDETLSLSKQFIEDTVQPILKRHFQRDEFLGRINEVLYFLPFSELELKQLTEKELAKWREIAKRRHGIDLQWDHAAVDLLRDGYNFRYGARSIQHEVEKRVVNQLAKYYEAALIGQGSAVQLTGDLQNGIELKITDSPQSSAPLSAWFGSGKSTGDGHTDSAQQKDENSSDKKWLW